MLTCELSQRGVWDTAAWHKAELLEAVLVMLLSGPVARNIAQHWVTRRDITPAGESG